MDRVNVRMISSAHRNNLFIIIGKYLEGLYFGNIRFYYYYLLFKHMLCMFTTLLVFTNLLFTQCQYSMSCRVFGLLQVAQLMWLGQLTL